MYEAEYDFSSDHKNILSFKAGERFLTLTNSSYVRPGWIFVVSSAIHCGYVPETYVKQSEVTEEEFDNFVVFLLNKARVASTESENGHEKNRCLRIVAQLEQKANKSKCESTQNEGCNESITQQKEQDVESCTNSTLGEVDEPILASSTQNQVQPSNSDVPNLLGCELIEYVKRETNLGHKQVRGAIESVLDFLGNRIPSVRPVTSAIMVSIKGSSPSGEALEKTHDWRRLRCIFSTILDVKSDVEQLNWALYEDQHIIVEFLEELISLSTDGDPVVCKRFLQKDQYRNVEALVQYFQMEVRPLIRQVLLKVFASLCTLDRTCISVLVNSDLPLLLARDIQESKQDLQKLTYSCLLLTMLLWTGETMPVNHYDVLNTNFVNYVLDLMENTSSDDDAEQIADSCTELLLAFNLQFKEPSTNVVMLALKSRNIAKEFLEKLLVLMNREDDPVSAMFEHSQPPPNAVHKMLLDIFGLEDTANLFYTNDLKVLIEIVCRKLLDLSPDEEVLTTYLLLAYNIICNTNYAEHGHCRDEFQQCFDKILNNDNVSSPKESVDIVHKLCSKFENLFHE